MLSFKSFLKESEFKDKGFHIEKTRIQNSFGGVHHIHSIKVDKHNLEIDYEENYKESYKMLPNGNYERIVVNEPEHYNISFTINGQMNRFSSKRPKHPEVQLGIHRAVLQSIKEFKEEAKPKSLSFQGDSRYKHKYWGKIGAKLADKFGGKFKKYPDSWHTSHRITFEE